MAGIFFRRVGALAAAAPALGYVRHDQFKHSSGTSPHKWFPQQAFASLLGPSSAAECGEHKRGGKRTADGANTGCIAYTLLFCFTSC